MGAFSNNTAHKSHQIVVQMTDFRPLVVLLFVLVSLVLAGCNPTKTQERPPEPGDIPVAKIQDSTIWASDVRREAVAQGLIGEGEPLDSSSDMFRRVLEEVVDQKLLAREAVRRGLDKSALAERRLAAARERILGDMLVESTVDAAIDESAVKALYNEQLKLSKQSEEVRARLILLKTKEEADAVARLLSNGALFEVMAMERSIDQATRFNGGDLGYFTTDVMPKSYVAAINSAKVGSVVGPFEADGGFAILKIEDRRQEQPLSLEEARPQILRFLTYDHVRQLLSKLRDSTRIVILTKGDPLNVPGAPTEPATADPNAPADAVAPDAPADTSQAQTASGAASAAPGDKPVAAPAAKVPDPVAKPSSSTAVSKPASKPTTKEAASKEASR